MKLKKEIEEIALSQYIKKEDKLLLLALYYDILRNIFKWVDEKEVKEYQNFLTNSFLAWINMINMAFMDSRKCILISSFIEEFMALLRITIFKENDLLRAIFYDYDYKYDENVKRIKENGVNVVNSWKFSLEIKANFYFIIDNYISYFGTIMEKSYGMDETKEFKTYLISKLMENLRKLKNDDLVLENFEQSLKYIMFNLLKRYDNAFDYLNFQDESMKKLLAAFTEKEQMIFKLMNFYRLSGYSNLDMLAREVNELFPSENPVNLVYDLMDKMNDYLLNYGNENFNKL